MQWKRCWLLQVLVLSGVPHPQTSALMWVTLLLCVPDKCEGDKFKWLLDSVNFAATSWHSQVHQIFFFLLATTNCDPVLSVVSNDFQNSSLSIFSWLAVGRLSGGIHSFGFYFLIILNVQMSSGAAELSGACLFLHKSPSLGCLACFSA